MSASYLYNPYLSVTNYILLIATICSIHSICPTHALPTAATSTSAGRQKRLIPRDGLVKTLAEDGLMTLTKIEDDNNNNYREVSIFVITLTIS